MVKMLTRAWPGAGNGTVTRTVFLARPAVRGDEALTEPANGAATRADPIANNPSALQRIAATIPRALSAFHHPSPRARGGSRSRVTRGGARPAPERVPPKRAATPGEPGV